MIDIDYLLLQVGLAFRRQRTRKTEVEYALIEPSKLVVRIHVVQLKLDIRIPAKIGLYEQRQNGRRRWSDEADAKDAHFPTRRLVARSVLPHPTASKYFLPRRAGPCPPQ